MANYNAVAGDLAVYEKTLVASTVDTVTFLRNFQEVEIYTDGTASIFFTVDGSTPTVLGPTCLYMPAAGSVRTVRVPKREASVVVKLISAGTPKYSVAEPVA